MLSVSALYGVLPLLFQSVVLCLFVVEQKNDDEQDK